MEMQLPTSLNNFYPRACYVHTHTHPGTRTDTHRGNLRLFVLAGSAPSGVSLLYTVVTRPLPLQVSANSQGCCRLTLSVAMVKVWWYIQLVEGDWAYVCVLVAGRSRNKELGGWLDRYKIGCWNALRDMTPLFRDPHALNRSHWSQNIYIKKQKQRTVLQDFCPLWIVSSRKSQGHCVFLFCFLSFSCKLQRTQASWQHKRTRESFQKLTPVWGCSQGCRIEREIAFRLHFVGGKKKPKHAFCESDKLISDRRARRESANFTFKCLFGVRYMCVITCLCVCVWERIKETLLWT